MSTSADHDSLRERVQTSLDRQGMMQALGVRLLAVAPGQVTLALPYSDRVTQQQGAFMAAPWAPSPTLPGAMRH